MTKHSKFLSFRIPDPMYDAIEAIKTRDGIPLSEQLRRALQLWLDHKATEAHWRAMPAKGRKR